MAGVQAAGVGGKDNQAVVKPAVRQIPLPGSHAQVLELQPVPPNLHRVFGWMHGHWRGHIHVILAELSGNVGNLLLKGLLLLLLTWKNRRS